MEETEESSDEQQATPPPPSQQQQKQQQQQQQQQTEQKPLPSTTINHTVAQPAYISPVVPQMQQMPVEVVPTSSWAPPIMTTMAVGQWTTDPPPHTYTQPQPAHWSHQQEQHQPMLDHFVIGSWAPEQQQQQQQQLQQQQLQQQQWGGETMQGWNNDNTGKLNQYRHVVTLFWSRAVSTLFAYIVW